MSFSDLNPGILGTLAEQCLDQRNTKYLICDYNALTDERI